MSTQELLNTLSRYDSRRKVKSNRRKLLKIKLEKIAKIQNISKNELSKAEKLQNKSIDELRRIARLRRIKNSDNLTKEDLIISLLKSKSSPAECIYMKHFNNNNTNDNTYDDKIRGKISDIRMMLSRLGNIVTKNYRKEIKKELDEIEKKENLSDKEKEENYDYLVNLRNTLNNKEKYQYHDRDDLDYYGIQNIENLFGDVDGGNDDDYYKPILVTTSFKNNYKYYESRGDKDKKLSVKQYLYKIMPYLSDLINDHKTIRNNSNKCKIQINMLVNFISSNDTGEIRTIFLWSDNKEIRSGNETDDIIKGLLNSFLTNYQNEMEVILYLKVLIYCLIVFIK